MVKISDPNPEHLQHVSGSGHRSRDHPHRPSRNSGSDDEEDPENSSGSESQSRPNSGLSENNPETDRLDPRIKDERFVGLGVEFVTSSIKYQVFHIKYSVSINQVVGNKYLVFCFIH